jgi:hypothetical protein
MVLHLYGVAHLSSGERVKNNAKKVPKKVHSHLALALCKPGENRSDLEARITEGRLGNDKKGGSPF